MITLFTIAFRNLLAHRSRSLMLGLAVAFTTLVLTLLLGLTAGIERTLEDGVTTLFSGHVNTNGFYKVSPSSAAPMLQGRAKALADVRALLPDAIQVTDRFLAYGKVIGEKASIESPMWGVDMNDEPKLQQKLIAAPEAEFGRSDIMAMAKPGGIAVYAKQAKKLQVKVGDMVTLSMPTARNINNTKDVKVVAVLKDMGFLSSFCLFLHRKDVQEIYAAGDDSTGQVLAYFKPGANLAKIEDRLRRGLVERGYLLREPDHKPVYMKFEGVANEPWTGQKLDVSTWKDEAAYMEWLVKVLKALSFGITLILLFIIAMGVMNAAWISVTERTKEIGTLRAIGMGRKPIMAMFVMESLLLASLACAAGMGLGLALCAGLNAVGVPVPSENLQSLLLSDRLTLAADPVTLSFAFFTITLLTTAGALYPAWKAGRMKPITAIMSA
jgi:putative ABC transport system permease protein